MRELVSRLIMLAAVGIGFVHALGSSRGRSASSGHTRDQLIGPVRKSSLKRWAIEVAVILAVFGLLGFLVAASGVIPIKASSGHWPITKWFLTFSKARSVSVHAEGTEVPDDLDDPARILRGAGHYETGCRSCHGSPSLPKPVIASAMTAEPPYLPPRISEWQPEELFHIVKHGIKFTGMPAWPALERDDEVWSMVAFLLAFPETAEQYEALVFGDTLDDTSVAPMEQMSGPATIPAEIMTSCSRCHGIDGNGRGNAAFPKLAGQKPTYLFNALKAYANGERHSGIMQPIAAGLDVPTMRALALYYASQPQRSFGLTHDAAAVERGRIIALEGFADKKIPACASCHGPSTTPAREAYPYLSGQYAGYLVQQLELFAEEHRGGSRWSHLMHPIAPKLTEEQRRDVAAYYESLGSVPSPLSAVRGPRSQSFQP